MHGTTVATNAVLTGKGAKVGLITTKGYRQVLQVARSFCPGGLGGWVSYVKTPLLAPLELTIEADERMGADGQSVSPLDKDLFEKDLELLNSKNKIEALTICFINSYVNGQHEIEAKEIAKKVLGDIPISISSEVVPEMQEYERAETTVVNSYVRPQVSKYVTNLQNSLQDKMSDDVNLAILRSDGGLASGRAAAESPVNLLLSGPAGGVAGAMYFCKRSGFENILTFDMGGTSTDVFHYEGEYERSHENNISGNKIKVPMLNINTIAAGGGSLIKFDGIKINVGPKSAGAYPGPACYGLGGPATITDCNLLLGNIQISNFPKIFGKHSNKPIDRKASIKALKKITNDILKFSKENISIYELAIGAISVANESMANAIRNISIEKGHDIEKHALVGYGAAAGQHICNIADSLNWDVKNA